MRPPGVLRIAATAGPNRIDDQRRWPRVLDAGNRLPSSRDTPAARRARPTGPRCARSCTLGVAKRLCTEPFAQLGILDEAAQCRGEAAGRPSGMSSPFSPCRMISAGPRGQSNAMRGTPLLIASMSTIGNPSFRDAMAKTECLGQHGVQVAGVAGQPHLRLEAEPPHELLSASASPGPRHRCAAASPGGSGRSARTHGPGAGTPCGHEPSGPTTILLSRRAAPPGDRPRDRVADHRDLRLPSGSARR